MDRRFIKRDGNILYTLLHSLCILAVTPNVCRSSPLQPISVFPLRNILQEEFGTLVLSHFDLSAAKSKRAGGGKRRPYKEICASHEPAPRDAACSMFSMMAEANSEVRSFVAPSIMRSRSYVTRF